MLFAFCYLLNKRNLLYKISGLIAKKQKLTQVSTIHKVHIDLY